MAHLKKRRGPYKRYLETEEGLPRSSKKLYSTSFIAATAPCVEGNEGCQLAAAAQISQTDPPSLVAQSEESAATQNAPFSLVYQREESNVFRNEAEELTNMHGEFLSSQTVQDLSDDCSRSTFSDIAMSSSQQFSAPSQHHEQVSRESEAVSDEDSYKSSDESISTNDEENLQHSDSEKSTTSNTSEDTLDNPVENKEENLAHLHQLLEGEYTAAITTPVTATRGQILLMALSMARQHAFNNKAFTDTINLINSIFGAPVLPSSKHLIDKLFKCELGLQRHFVCDKCKHYLGVMSSSQCKDDFICGKCSAVTNISDISKASYFVTFDVPTQLEVLLNKLSPVFLFNPKDSLCRDENSLSDVYDGKSYKAFAQKYAVDKPENIKVLSFSFCVDGTPLFSSSSCEIWPLNIMIWELPLHLRMSNLILGGLWFGKGKPDMNSFFQPFVQHLEEMSAGFQINVNQEVWDIQAYLISCCVDSGARGSVQCISTHGGYFSCNWCEIPGVYLEGHVRYPPGDKPAPPRTQETLITNGRSYLERMKRGRHAFPPNATPYEKAALTKGVKGLSEMSKLESMNLVEGLIVEHAHAILLGIVRHTMSKWESKYSAQVLEINELIKQLTPPIEVRRFPRTLDDKVHFKAKECENWLLFFSVPIMMNILPPNTLRHWMLLAEGYFLLSKAQVSLLDVQNAQFLFTQFYLNINEFYSDTDYSFNSHILLHVPQNVVRWGPLFATSGLGFEDGNGNLKKIIHSSQGIPHQVCRTVAQEQALLLLEKKCQSEKTKNFHASIASRQRAKKAFVTATCTYLGTSRKFSPSTTELWLCNRQKIDCREFTVFDKIVKDHIVFTSVYHNKRGKRDNSNALLLDGSFVSIQNIIVNEKSGEGFIFCCKLNLDLVFNPPRQVSILAKDHFLYRVTYVTRNLLLIPVEALKMICVRSKLSHGDFISPMPNVINLL